MHLKSTLMAAAALLAALPTQAEDGAWYLTARLGAATQASQTLSFSGGGSVADGRLRYGPGLLSGAAVGRDLGAGWRVEGEFTYQSTGMDRAPFSSPGPAGKGNHAATSLALNVLREFDLVGRPSVRTYLGLGVVRLTEVDIDFESAGQPEQSFSTSGTGWQVLAGARYDLGARWFVDAGVRWLHGPRLRMSGEGATAGAVDARFRPWALTAGIGRRF